MANCQERGEQGLGSGAGEVSIGVQNNHVEDNGIKYVKTKYKMLFMEVFFLLVGMGLHYIHIMITLQRMTWSVG